MGTSFMTPFYTLFDSNNKRIGFIGANTTVEDDLAGDAYTIILVACISLLISLLFVLCMLKYKKFKQDKVETKMSNSIFENLKNN